MQQLGDRAILAMGNKTTPSFVGAAVILIISCGILAVTIQNNVMPSRSLHESSLGKMSKMSVKVINSRNISDLVTGGEVKGLHAGKMRSVFHSSLRADRDHGLENINTGNALPGHANFAAGSSLSNSVPLEFADPRSRQRGGLMEHGGNMSKAMQEIEGTPISGSGLSTHMLQKNKTGSYLASSERDLQRKESAIVKYTDSDGTNDTDKKGDGQNIGKNAIRRDTTAAHSRNSQAEELSSLKYAKPFENGPFATTIVTGFWPPSGMAVRKRDDSVYWEGWIPNLMKCKTPIVAHTGDAAVADRLRGVRGELPIIILVENLSTFYTERYRGILDKKRAKDPEKFQYATEYSMVMHEKANLLREAIKENPFSSEYFFWVDIGIDRRNFLPGKFWPLSIPLWVQKNEGVVVNDVIGRVKGCRGLLRPEAVQDLYGSPQIGIGGGIFGGRKQSVLRFVSDYYGKVDAFVNSSARLTSDQVVLSALACEGKIGIVTPPGSLDIDSKWFYILHSFGRENTSF